MKRLWIEIIKLLGWKFDLPEGEHPEFKHAVYIEAPHTSMRDFFLGAACVWQLGTETSIFVKKEFFNWFTNPFLRWAGCLPIDRGNIHNNHTATAVNYFNTHEKFAVIICPEGTRKWVKRWKRGFYEIAVQANVPIVLTYIDYKTRHLGLGPLFYPTGDYANDIKTIMDFYRNISACHPENYNPDANL